MHNRIVYYYYSKNIFEVSTVSQYYSHGSAIVGCVCFFVGQYGLCNVCLLSHYQCHLMTLCNQTCYTKRLLEKY